MSERPANPAVSKDAIPAPELVPDTGDQFDDFSGPGLSRIWLSHWMEQGPHTDGERIAFGNYFGRRGVKITVYPGDGGEESVERAEIGEPKRNLIPSGTEVLYSFSVLVDDAFVDSNNRTVIAQWKALDSNTSPPMAWRYLNGNLLFSVEGDGGRRVSEPYPVKKDTWLDLSLRYIVRPDRSGACEARINGQTIMRYEGKVGSETDHTALRFKMGVYRDRTVAVPESVYFSDYSRVVQK